MKTIEQRLKELEERSMKDAAEIASLREALAQHPTEPWETEKGLYTVDVSGGVHKASSIDYQNKLWPKSGRTFATHEAAERASKWFTFYQRLYKLAEYCNAKNPKEVSYNYGVVWDNSKWRQVSQHKPSQSPTQIFHSHASAQEACDIMNKDGWTLPTELP